MLADARILPTTNTSHHSTPHKRSPVQRNRLVVHQHQLFLRDDNVFGVQTQTGHDGQVGRGSGETAAEGAVMVGAALAAVALAVAGTSI